MVMTGSEGMKNGVATTRSILRGNHIPMWIYDRKTLHFLEVSEGAIRLYGYSRAEFLRMTVQELRHFEDTFNPGQLDPFFLNSDYLDPDNLGSGQLWMHQRKDGTKFPVRTCSNALIYNGRVARLVVAQNVTQEPGMRPQLSHLDWTTGLPNRLLLERKAQDALDRADGTGRRVAVVCMDLDNLEDVAERLGGEGADECLKQIGWLLTRRVRGMDTVARTGLKAFTLVLAELDDDFDLFRVAEALLKTFVDPIMIAGEPVVMSASVGIAVYPDDGFEINRLCRAADTAMQQARASGGHRIAMFSLKSRERTELAGYMRESIKLDRFRLYYQPQYSVEGTICKFEALLRLPGKDGVLIPPDLFIPVAEESGMIEQLGLWVIEHAACQAREWQDEFGSQIPIAVNVSPLQLKAPGFADRALSVIDDCGVDPSIIEFEITERAVLNFDEVVEPMRQLTQAGIVFAVDDFGTGYSSLQHLHRLPISVLKIDRSFVQRMGVPQGSEAIVEAIVSMAHTLGMKVVAEGVETQAQRDLATGMGCDSIQGFLHSPAVERDKVPALVGWATQEIFQKTGSASGRVS